jgi:short-subunit dehydrogenase/uncharacterized protein YbjT (DUF2867 family)
MGVDLLTGDIWDADLLARGLAEADYVIHCAGNAVFGNGPAYRRENLEMTIHLLGASRKCATLQRFVFVSTIGAVDRAPTDDCVEPLTEESPLCPSSDYGRSKQDAEIAVIASGIPYCIVRPAMVVGKEMRYGSHFSVFARWAIEGRLFSRIAWPGALSIVHVDDLAKALIAAALHPEAAGKRLFCAGAPLSIAACFRLAAPGRWRLSIPNFMSRLPNLPFSLRVLLLPALVADDARLRSLGWSPAFDSKQAVSEVIRREQCRAAWRVDPGGQTVITGAASGLGLALVERLAPMREWVLLIDRDEAGLLEVITRFPHCRYRVMDLADSHSIAALISSGEWCAHPVTELFACAGFGLKGAVQDLAVTAQADIFAVNVIARLFTGHAAAAGMRRLQMGRIVFISSLSAFQPLPFMAVYAASNAALLFLGEAWAAELSGHGIQMLTVCPGGMQTNFQKTAGVRELDGESLMAPGEVADRILVRLDRGGGFSHLVSARAYSMALLARILPRVVSVRLWEKLMEKMR